MGEDAHQLALSPPGGDAGELDARGQAWAELSRRLSAHGDELERLAAAAPAQWQGSSVDAFLTRLRSAAATAESLSARAGRVSGDLQRHAGTHAGVTRVILEVLSQIAVLLAFWATAVAFPFLLAWTQAWLDVLITTGIRQLAVLARALDTVTRQLRRARALATKWSSRSWQGQHLQLGYGRALVEGGRDMAIDLTANVTASGLLRRRIDPASLFISAGVGGGVGGLIGGLERSGLRSATIADQIRGAARRVGSSPRPAGPAPGRPGRTARPGATSGTARLYRHYRHNAVRSSLSSPSPWQDVVFYDLPKELVKGTGNGAAKSGTEVARGRAAPGDVWRTALLGGATGMARGSVNSTAVNRLYPSAGVEETFWKLGSRTLDDFVRRRIAITSGPGGHKASAGSGAAGGAGRPA